MINIMTQSRFGWWIELFFILLPFAYLAQVLTGYAEIAAVAYVPLFFAAMAWVEDGSNVRTFGARLLRRPYDPIGIGIIFLLLHTGIAVILGLGDLKYGIRGLFIYFVPLAIIPLIQYAKDATIIRVVKVVAICGALVAAELTYENLNIYILEHATLYQRLNYSYVHAHGGRYLAQLYATNYRPTGLLEHVHASVMWVGISAIASLATYFIEGRRYQLILFSFCSVVFALHGVRLMFGALAIGVTIFLFSQCSGSRLELQKVKTASVVFGLAIMAALLLDPFGTVRLYYLPALLRNDFGIPNGEIPSNYYLYETSRFLVESPIGQFFRGDFRNLEIVFHVVFGFGVINALRGTVWASDDVYFLQLLSQYGLFGSALFFGMWFYAIRICYRCCQRSASPQRVLVGFSMTILLVCLISIVHSGVISRKAIYPLFIFAIALAYRFRSMQLDMGEQHVPHSWKDHVD